MLNGIFQRPYLNQNTKTLVKNDQEQTASANQEQNSNEKSKGLQYIEPRKSAYQEQQVDWRQMRSQIQAQAKQNSVDQIQPTKDLSGRNPVINIAQILKDFRNTAAAIGTPENLNEEVNSYLSLVEKQVHKENPNIKIIKSNLKNASSILDGYISETLNKDSKVVENWIDALFLQQIDFKYNEDDINPQFLVKFPENKQKETQTENNVEHAQKNMFEQKVEQNQKLETKTEVKSENIVPQDKELKSLFIQSKKLAYANKPEKAIENFKKALDRADKIGDTETKSKIFYEVGRIYDDNSFFAEALKSYNESIQNTKDNNVKTKAHYSMAQIYDDVNQLEPAINHYLNSISFAGETENFAAQSTSLTKIGNIFTDLYDKDAIEYYSVAEDLAQQTDNQKVKGFVSASFGNAYQTFGESQKALKSYSDAVKHYTEAESPSKVAQNYTKAADIMIEFSNVSKAKGLLTKAQNFARKTDNNDLLNEINDKLKNLELL